MVKGFTLLIDLAVVVALALAAVFGSMSLANPAWAQAAPEADGSADLTREVYSETSFEVDVSTLFNGGTGDLSYTATTTGGVTLTSPDGADAGTDPDALVGDAVPVASDGTATLIITGSAATDATIGNVVVTVSDSADTPNTASVTLVVTVLVSTGVAAADDDIMAQTAYVGAANDPVSITSAFTPGTGAGAEVTYSATGTGIDDHIDGGATPAIAAGDGVCNGAEVAIVTINDMGQMTIEGCATTTAAAVVTVTASDEIAAGTDPTKTFNLSVENSTSADEATPIMDMDADAGADPVEVILGPHFTPGKGTGKITGYDASSDPGGHVSLRIGMVTDDMGTPEDATDDMMVNGLIIRPLTVGYTTITVYARDSFGNMMNDPMQEFVFEVTAVETVEPPAPDPVNPTFKASSYNPGKNARYTIEFNARQRYVPGVHDLVVQFTDEDFQVPETISTSAVTIQAGYNVANPNDVSVDDQEITLVLGDMDPDADGVQAIGKGQNVTIIFRTAAGIANPEEGGGYGDMSVDGQDLLWADGEMNANGMPTDKEVSINRTISLSEDEGGRGDEIMVTGKGFKNGTSVTFLRMESDSVKPADFAAGTGLCVAEASNGVAACSFTVTSPLFQHGDNFINGIDGRSNMGNESEPFDLEPSISVNPSAGSPGESLLVQLYDFGPGATVENVKIARRTLCRPDDGGAISLMLACGQGYSAWIPQGLSFRVVIPNDAPLGRQDLQVNTTDGSDNTNITITGPLVTSTPSTVLANQRVSLVGNGFTPSSTLREITFAGTVIDSSRINDGLEVRIDGGGNWNASVNLPLNTSTVSAGEHTVQIEDMGGRTGTLKVTVPEREVTITPSSGRVGTIAVVRGENFPSRNEEGNSFNVQIVYGSGDASSTTVSTVPDASGRFEAQMRIPTTSAIPSTNDVSVSFGTAQNGGPWTINVSHDVPEGIISLSATSGGPGSGLSISGEGFRSFVPVNSVMIGSIDITPTPRPSSDANGMVSFDVVVPGLDVGIQTIEVQVGKTTASAGFTVTESGVNPGDITAVMAAVEPLGDNLVSAWNFNNDTKVWSFYDPTLAEGNTLTHMITGETYLIRIKTDAEVILNRDTRNLTCVGDNCWNQIVW